MSFRFTLRVRLIGALMGAALISACTSEPERSENDDRDAGGEVLEGTISDEMIQLDQLRSQGEPMEEVDETAGGDADDDAPQAAPAPAEAEEVPAEPVEPAPAD